MKADNIDSMKTKTKRMRTLKYIRRISFALAVIPTILIYFAVMDQSGQDRVMNMLENLIFKVAYCYAVPVSYFLQLIHSPTDWSCFYIDENNWRYLVLVFLLLWFVLFLIGKCSKHLNR